MSKLENWLKVTNFNLLHPCLKFKFLTWKKWDEYLVLCSTILANFRLVKINHKFNTKCQSIGWKWPTLTHLITFKIRSFCLKKNGGNCWFCVQKSVKVSVFWTKQLIWYKNVKVGELTRSSALHLRPNIVPFACKNWCDWDIKCTMTIFKSKSELVKLLIDRLNVDSYELFIALLICAPATWESSKPPT